MMTYMPLTDTLRRQETYDRAKQEAALRAMKGRVSLLGRLPGDKRAARLYLEASRVYEESK